MSSRSVQVAERLGGGGAIDVPIGRVVIACALCLAIALLAILLIRQRTGRGDAFDLVRRLAPGAGKVEVVEVRRLTLHADVGLIRHDGREYLLLVQAGSHRVLREQAISPVAEPAP